MSWDVILILFTQLLLYSKNTHINICLNVYHGYKFILRLLSVNIHLASRTLVQFRYYVNIEVLMPALILL